MACQREQAWSQIPWERALRHRHCSQWAESYTLLHSMENQAKYAVMGLPHIGQTHRPVGWSGHFLGSSQLERIHNTQNLTIQINCNNNEIKLGREQVCAGTSV